MPIIVKNIVRICKHFKFLVPIFSKFFKYLLKNQIIATRLTIDLSSLVENCIQKI